MDNIKVLNYIFQIESLIILYCMVNLKAEFDT